MPVFSFWNFTTGCFSPTVSNMSDQNHGCRDLFAQAICRIHILFAVLIQLLRFFFRNLNFPTKTSSGNCQPETFNKSFPSTTGFRQRRTCQTSPNVGVVCVRDAKLVKQPFFLLLHEKKHDGRNGRNSQTMVVIYIIYIYIYMVVGRLLSFWDG